MVPRRWSENEMKWETQVGSKFTNEMGNHCVRNEIKSEERQKENEKI